MCVDDGGGGGGQHTALTPCFELNQFSREFAHLQKIPSEITSPSLKDEPQFRIQAVREKHPQ